MNGDDRLNMKLLIIAVPLWFYCESGGDLYKGRSYPIYASLCLDDIVGNHSNLGDGPVNNDSPKLLTFIVTDNLTSPAHEIQENIIKLTSSAPRRLLIEVVSLGDRYQFSSYSACQNGTCRRHFVVKHTSSFCIVVIDEENDFEEVLEIINSLSTFNPVAYFLIHLEKDVPDSRAVAGTLLWRLWQNLISSAAILIPQDSQTFNLYKLDFTIEGPEKCASRKKTILVDQCRQGRMQQERQFYFADNHQKNYFNCSIGVIAKPYSPFVIDENEGFEIELLKTFAMTLNLHLNISLDNSTMESLGSRSNSSWTRSLKLLYEQLYLAVGNIEVGGNDTTDFEFTKSYHMEPLVMVVPKAKLVPRWRVFIAIFTPQMWAICLGVIILFALLFFCSNRYFQGSKDCSLEDSFLSSFQVTLGQPVNRQPSTGQDLLRVFFVSLNIFGIIIYSVYTCSLVYYLKNPIREYQLNDERELFDQFGNLRYGVGGIHKYKEVFAGRRVHDQIFIENYQTISRENESVAYWVEVVGNRSDFVTIASQFYVNFLLANNNNITTYPDGKPKIFVFNKNLLVYAVGVMVRKGHPLLNDLNDFIKKLLSGGFILFWHRKYRIKIGKDDAMDNMTNDNPFESLTTDHLQGAFAILAMGYAVGLLVLFLENVYKKLADVRKKSIKSGYIP